MQSMVSIIIPTYNSGKYIKRAIDSVLIQNTEKEIIVIDDASTDNTIDIIRPYISCNLIKYIYNSHNIGVAESRNKGVKIARGHYIAFLDADDWWAENKLERQLRYIKENKLKLCGTARVLVTDSGYITNRQIHIENSISYRKLLYHNSLACSSVIIDRNLALEIPMQHSEVHEDYLTWLKILKLGNKAGGLDEPLLYYRLSVNGKSRNPIKSAGMTYGVYRKLGYGKFKSLIFLASHLVHGIKKYY